MDEFTAHMNLRGALELYIFLSVQEDQLSGVATALYSDLRVFLYDRLSIEDMEFPETFLSKLDTR